MYTCASVARVFRHTGGGGAHGRDDVRAPLSEAWRSRRHLSHSLWRHLPRGVAGRGRGTVRPWTRRVAGQADTVSLALSLFLALSLSVTRPIRRAAGSGWYSAAGWRGGERVGFRLTTLGCRQIQ